MATCSKHWAKFHSIIWSHCKAVAYLSGAPYTLRAPANIRPDRKGCTGTIALDYFGATTLRMTTLSLTAESQHNTNNHFPVSTGTQLNLRFCPAMHGILFQSSPPHPCHGMDVNGKGSFLAPKLKLHLYVHRLLTLNLLLLTPLFPPPQVSLCCLSSYRVSRRRSFCLRVGDGEEKNVFTTSDR